MKANRFRFRAWDSRTRQLINPAPIWMMVEIIEKESKIGEMGIYLMQSTGLTDSKGVEVFEGDILKHFDPKRPRVDFSCVRVVWKSAKCKLTFEGRGYTMNPEDCSGLTIVGNVHQNPELLKAG